MGAQRPLQPHAGTPGHEKRITHARVEHGRAGKETVGETLMDEQEADFIAGILLPARIVQPNIGFISVRSFARHRRLQIAVLES